MNKEDIENFFKGVIVNGCTRQVIFAEHSEEGYIEVELVAPPQVNIASVYLSFPTEGKKRWRTKK